MRPLQVTARLNIHPGKLNEFKEIATRCLASTKEKDSGTLQYDWFLSEDQAECVVREIYTDSNAGLAHVANLGDLFGKVLEFADLSLEIYGDVSDELRGALASLNVKYYSFYQGL